MACVPIPTETLFDTVITIGQSATFSGSVTTIPPDVTTIVSTTCSVVGDGGPRGSDCVDVPITVVSTIDGTFTTSFYGRKVYLGVVFVLRRDI